MMTINKRFIRDLKNNLSFYICTVSITAAVVMLYIMLAGAVNGEKDYMERLLDERHVEDAQFTMYLDMSDEDMKRLEDKYDLSIEKQEYAEYENDKGDLFRIYRPTKDIDLYKVTEGEDISSDNDILISKSYAEANKLSLEDTLAINGHDYKIKGFFIRPDYLYPVKNLSDSDPSFDSFSLVMMSENAFDKLAEEDVSSYCSVIYNKENSDDFRKELYEDFKTSSYLNKDSNRRIKSLKENVDTYVLINGTVFPVMLIMTILIIAVVMGRKIHGEQKMIGILCANGYNRRQLAIHYSISGIVAGVLGSLLGIIAGLATVRSTGSTMFMKFEPVPADYTVTAAELVFLALSPAIIYFLATLVITLRLLRKDAIDMINRTDDGKAFSRFRMEKNDISQWTKYRLRAVLGKFSRSLVLVIGIAVSSIFLVYSLCLTDSLKNYADNAVEKTGDFEYEYYLNTLEKGELDNAAAILTTSAEREGSDSIITLMGMNNNVFINTTLITGEEADLSGDHVYISRMAAKIFQVDKGDSLTLSDPNSMKKGVFEIDGVIDNDTQSVLYMSRAKLADYMKVDHDMYNMVASKEKLDYSGNELILTVTRESFAKQARIAFENMTFMMYMLMAFGAFFCVLIIYLMVNMFIGENVTIISMLKVLGYQDRRVNRIVTSVYHMLIPIGIIAGLLAGIGFTKYTSEMLVDLYNTYIETTISPISVFVYVAIVVCTYLFSLVLLRGKVRKVSLVECLKYNRE